MVRVSVDAGLGMEGMDCKFSSLARMSFARADVSLDGGIMAAEQDGQPAVKTLSAPSDFKCSSRQFGWNNSRHFSRTTLSLCVKLWWHLAHSGGAYSEDASHSG